MSMFGLKAFIQSKKNTTALAELSNQVVELENTGVDTTARASIAEISSKVEKVSKEKILVSNATTSTEGVFELENFAQQGSAAPWGAAVHHYTDGVALQIDNVGASNSVFVIKNAHNPIRRPDKAGDFIGTGTFVKLTEDAEHGRGDLLIIDKDANFNWRGDRKVTLQNQRPENTVDPAFVIDTLNFNKYMLALASIGSVKLYFNWDNSAMAVTLQTPSGVTGGMIYDVLKGDLVLRAREAGKAVKINDSRDTKVKQVQTVNSCTTTARPTTNIVVGEQWFDTTLNKPIWRNAANDGWVDATGTAV